MPDQACGYLRAVHLFADGKEVSCHACTGVAEQRKNLGPAVVSNSKQ